MKLFLLHLGFVVLWLGFAHTHNAVNMLTGFAVGYAIIAAYCQITRKSMYHIRLIRAVQLLLVFLRELVTSSVRVIWDILTPTQKSNPGFISMPLDAKTDAEIFFTANLISLTPGTLSMDISYDRSTLYIHAMFLDTTTVASLKYLESKVLEVFR